MSDWDASEEESTSQPAPNVPVRKAAAWDDEDADSDVKESWSDSEDEEGKAAQSSSGPAPPVRQKGITKQKIAEKEAAERARVEARAQQAALEADPAERKKREQAQQLKSDMENVAGLFGSAAVSNSDDLLSSNPRSKEDFDDFANKLAELLAAKHGSKAFYSHFVESFARALCEPLKDLDVRKTSSTLATLANEKQKAQREASGTGKKKSKKPGLGTIKAAGTGGSYDTRAYDESLDDYGAYNGPKAGGGGRYDDDDFM